MIEFPVHWIFADILADCVEVLAAPNNMFEIVALPQRRSRTSEPAIDLDRGERLECSNYCSQDRRFVCRGAACCARCFLRRSKLSNNRVNMIWHHDKRIERQQRKTIGQANPGFPHCIAGGACDHFAVADLPEHRFAIVRTDGDEIHAGLRIVVEGKTNRAAFGERSMRHRTIVPSNGRSKQRPYERRECRQVAGTERERAQQAAPLRETRVPTRCRDGESGRSKQRPYER